MSNLPSSTEVDATDRLAELRSRIDNLDRALVYLLAERFTITDEIGLIKRDAGLDAADHTREQRQREDLAAHAQTAGVSPPAIDEIHRAITAIVRSRHEEIRNR